MASQSTFMTGYTTAPGANYTYNRDSWRRAVAAQPNVSPHAIKSAIQREARDRGATVSPALQRDYMKHYYGIGHGRGFLKHMGRWGNLGGSGYTSAKGEGFTPQEIWQQSQLYGLKFGPASQKMYDADTEVKAPELDPWKQQAESMRQWQTDVADMMKAFTQEPAKPPEETALRGQVGQLRPKSGRLAQAGTNQFKRGYTPKRNMMNLGITGAGSVGSLNIA